MVVSFPVPLGQAHLPSIGATSLVPQSHVVGPALASPAVCLHGPRRSCAPTAQPTARDGGGSRHPWELLPHASFWRPPWPPLEPACVLRQPALPECRAPPCSSSARDAAEAAVGAVAGRGVAEGGEGTPQLGAWPPSGAAQLVAGYRREAAHQGGRLVIQPLDVQHYEAAVELLAVSFADSIDAGALLGYIRTQIVKYLAEQERFFAKGQGVCLVALWYPPPASPEDPPSADAMLVGTVSLAFAVRSLPRFPTLNIPPDRSSAYLSNMAVESRHRRRGVARQLLAASEELAAALGKRALYLHVRFIDEVPQRVYAAAGYAVVARDTPLSWLFLQRRRNLMRKHLAPRAATTNSPESTIS